MASTTFSAQFLAVCRRLKRMYTARVDPEKARLLARDEREDGTEIHHVSARFYALQSVRN